MVHPSFPLWLDIPVGAIGLFFSLHRLVHGLSERRARTITGRDILLSDGDFGDQYLVEVTIVVEGMRIGLDRGAIWFADGVMGFNGRAASFVLAARDLEAQWFIRGRRNERIPLDALVLVDYDKSAYLSIKPLGNSPRAFRSRLRQFFVAAESPATDRVWPPLTPYREIRKA